jgi:carboxyl-terminal processing protease
MDTLASMFKRILMLAGAAIAGFAACLGSLRMAGAWSLPRNDLDRSASYLKEVMKTVNENYVDANASGYDSLARLSLHGMIDSLDPHSQFLEAKDYQELQEDLTGEYGGIGVEVEVHKGAFSVINPIAGSPGERAGIRLGDQILSIDGSPVEHNVPMDKIVDRLRGKPHTHVRVGLLRPSDGRHLDLDLVREVITVMSIRGTRVIGGSTGYIQVQEFNDHTGEQFDDALNDLLRKGIDGLVIDLRNNPGGPLEAAVAVAEPFFKKDDLIVYYQGRRAADRENYLSETDGEPIKIPVAVLVNDLTASAAEIVAGALKDSGHAVVVGERSYGKGSVQTIYKERNGEGLRLTTAHYFTPSGALINGRGIMPQVEVVMTPDEDQKIEEQTSRPDISDPVQFKERFDFTPIEDRQLDAALDVLKVARSFNR